MGYDPEWREYGVGKVLQLRVIEDLCNHESPAIYDLGEFGTHKEELGTDQHLEAKLFLFRRGIPLACLRTAHRFSRKADHSISAVLDYLSLKQKLKKMVRLWRTG
jgi:hypothetical protein